jgi:hypothetical protein
MNDRLQSARTTRHGVSRVTEKIEGCEVSEVTDEQEDRP